MIGMDWEIHEDAEESFKVVSLKGPSTLTTFSMSFQSLPVNLTYLPAFPPVLTVIFSFHSSSSSTFKWIFTDDCWYIFLQLTSLGE